MVELQKNNDGIEVTFKPADDVEYEKIDSQEFLQMIDLSPQAKVEEIIETLKGRTVSEVEDILEMIYIWIHKNAKI